MKISSATYQSLSKVSALLLLLAFLIPSGLHAKDFVEFCMMDTDAVEMAEHQDDCHTTMDHQDTMNDDHATHSDCDWGFVCACSIGQSQLADKDWVPTHKDIEVVLTKTGVTTPFFTTTEEFPAYHQPRIGEYKPPLWLLYDTFLM